MSLIRPQFDVRPLINAFYVKLASHCRTKAISVTCPWVTVTPRMASQNICLQLQLSK